MIQKTGPKVKEVDTGQESPTNQREVRVTKGYRHPTENIILIVKVSEGMCATVALKRPVNKLTAAHGVPCRSILDLLGWCVKEGAFHLLKRLPSLGVGEMHL